MSIRAPRRTPRTNRRVAARAVVGSPPIDARGSRSAIYRHAAQEPVKVIDAAPVAFDAGKY